MDAQRTVPERVAFDQRFDRRQRRAVLALGATAGLALGAVAAAASGGRIGVGGGWVAATATAGLLAGLAASWSP